MFVVILIIFACNVSATNRRKSAEISTNCANIHVDLIKSIAQLKNIAEYLMDVRVFVLLIQREYDS